MEASLVEISICTKFQIKIRKYDFSKIWGPTGSIGHTHKIP
jgi:hypothetical protein